eukprot:6190099-Pleurochrysis_carterae.AAC.1
MHIRGCRDKYEHKREWGVANTRLLAHRVSLGVGGRDRAGPAKEEKGDEKHGKSTRRRVRAQRRERTGRGSRRRRVRSLAKSAPSPLTRLSEELPVGRGQRLQGVQVCARAHKTCTPCNGMLRAACAQACNGAKVHVPFLALVRVRKPDRAEELLNVIVSMCQRLQVRLPPAR